MSISDKLNIVQNLIIQEHREQFDESPTPMKLQKLCYYAQGLALAMNKTELFPDDFQAWQHGPVNPELYSQYKHYRWKAIDVDIDTIQDSQITEDEKNHIQKVVSAFGRFDGAALSTMTHREEPWLEARQGIPEDHGSTELIKKSTMESYFSKQLIEIEE